MPIQDALHWDNRYCLEPRFQSNIQARDLLRKYAYLLPKQGLALDVAMGLGGNAKFLIQRDLRVIGVDISRIAIVKAKNNVPNLMAVVADLDDFYLPRHTFDVLLNFYYLNRNLWADFRQILKPAGLLFIETLTMEMHQLNPKIEPEYLLNPGELNQYFNNWEIIDYFEGWKETNPEHPRAIASLVARAK